MRGSRSELGVIDAPAFRGARLGSRVGRRAPATLGTAIGALLIAGTAAAVHGVGGVAAVQLVGVAHAATVTHDAGPAVTLGAGSRLRLGDVVTTGPTGGVTLDAGANRLFVGPASSVLVDSPTTWTLRSGQVGLASAAVAGPREPSVLAGTVTVVAAPGSGVRIQRAATVQAAALRGTASVVTAEQTLHLATFREVNVQGSAVAAPQLVQSLDDSVDGVDAQLAPELVALDTALSRLATQVGADPRAAALFGTSPLTAGDVALEDALRRLAGQRVDLVSAGDSGRVAWGILAAQAGADDAQVRAYVGAVLDGTVSAPTSQPVVGSSGNAPPYVAAAAPQATATSAAPGHDTTSPAPSRDTGSGDTGATQAPAPPATAAATSAPVVADSPTPAAPTTDAPTTEAPTTDAPTTDAPTTDAPTTDPASAAPPGAVAPDGAQSAPQAAGAAAAAGPLGMLVVLARGARGPGSTPTPTPRSGPGTTSAPSSAHPSARPTPRPSASVRPTTPRSSSAPPRKSLAPNKKSVPSARPTTPPATHRPTVVPTTRAPVVTVTAPAATPVATKAPATTTAPTKATASPQKPGPVATLLCPVLGSGSLCGRNRAS